MQLLSTVANGVAPQLCCRLAGYRQCRQAAIIPPGANQGRLPRQRRPAQRRPAQLKALEATDGAIEPLPEPEDARGAIAVGLKLFDAGDHEGALRLFMRALELPGTGTKRFRDKPPGISDGEKQSAYYNIACCYSKMGVMREGLVAVAGCVEAGYTDFNQLRTDPDLEALRVEPKFEGLLAQFEKKGGGLSRLLEGFF